jgi:hypothetical protein
VNCWHWPFKQPQVKHSLFEPQPDGSFEGAQPKRGRQTLQVPPPGLQLTGPPGTQFPPLQKSLLVQGSPSLHDPEIAARTHIPVAWSQESAVQTL